MHSLQEERVLKNHIHNIMRLTTCVLLLCNLRFSPALLNFFPDPAVEDGASPPLMNFAAGQPNFDNEQPGAKHRWDEPSSFDISALNVQYDYQITDANRDCGRGAGAKFRKRGSLVPKKLPNSQPASNPKRPTSPEDLPAPKDHAGIPSEDYEHLNDHQYVARSPWMTRIIATEDDESGICKIKKKSTYFVLKA